MWTSVFCCVVSIWSRLFRSLPLQCWKEKSSFWQRISGKLSHWLATLKLHPWDQGNIMGLLEGSQILGPMCALSSFRFLDCIFGLEKQILQLVQPSPDLNLIAAWLSKKDMECSWYNTSSASQDECKHDSALSRLGWVRKEGVEDRKLFSGTEDTLIYPFVNSLNKYLLHISRLPDAKH